MLDEVDGKPTRQLPFYDVKPLGNILAALGLSTLYRHVDLTKTDRTSNEKPRNMRLYMLPSKAKPCNFSPL